MRRPCCDKEATNKGAWTRQEDQKLIDYIRVHGVGCWHSLTKAAGLDRCGKSCRLRWINYLRPDIKRGNFAPDEEDLIIKLHALLGNRWSLIAGRLPGRTDNEVKNYWNTHLRKKLIKMGIDPNNHKLKSMPQLHYHHHEPQQCNSASTNMAFKPKEETINGDNNNTVSDSGSCLEDDGPSVASSSHDFNLDLNVTFSPKKMENNTVPITSGEVESDEIPTLLLFN